MRQIRPREPPQLPVSWYFDPEIFELEKKLLFDAGANYVGHELMVPKVGDYHTLAWTDDAWMLVRNREEDATASSCCRTSAATARRSCSGPRQRRRTSSARCTAGPTT